MPPNARALCCALSAILVAACSTASVGPVASVGPAATTDPAATSTQSVPGREADPTTADGIFTTVQADRGHALFRSNCSECHDESDWIDTAFRRRWEDESVFRLWYYINDRMPYDDPWSLTRQQVTDVLAYILRLNDLPAGDTELATDDDSIDDYWITWGPT